MPRKSKRKKPAPIRTRITSALTGPWRDRNSKLVALVWLGWIAALACAWTFGVPKLRAAVAAHDRTDPITIEFVDLPAWVQGDLLALLDQVAAQPLAQTHPDQAGLDRIRWALLETEWFDAIEQVRHERPDLIRVYGRFVQPFAVIRDAEGDHLIDPYGKLLPRSFPEGAAESGRALTVILGAHFDRPSRPGPRWEGADVAAALGLLRLIDQRPWARQVTTIDTTRYLSDQRLTLLTNRGSRIVWGSAPGEESGLEMLAARKLDYLDFAYREVDHIDAGHHGESYFGKDHLISR